METQTIIINTTDNDGDSYFQAELGVYRMKRSGNLAELNIWNKTIHPKMATKDPMGEALTDYFIQLLNCNLQVIHPKGNKMFLTNKN